MTNLENVRSQVATAVKDENSGDPKVCEADICLILASFSITTHRISAPSSPPQGPAFLPLNDRTVITDLLLTSLTLNYR